MRAQRRDACKAPFFCFLSLSLCMPLSICLEVRSSAYMNRCASGSVRRVSMSLCVNVAAALYRSATMHFGWIVGLRIYLHGRRPRLGGTRRARCSSCQPF